MSDLPSLARADMDAILAALQEQRANGRRVDAIEIHPTRRLFSGPARVFGIDLVSNGLLRRDAFTLKVKGRVLRYDDMDYRFSSRSGPLSDAEQENA